MAAARPIHKSVEMTLAPGVALRKLQVTTTMKWKMMMPSVERRVAL